ncbi:uncharacterized protein LOC111262557, partial [Varroa jacobsoni]|uniref:uncharacterized protein LOC111262557 n=1 Tax=Varroa jacobsoni TaxID=62625 RepID=UPI000BF78EB0
MGSLLVLQIYKRLSEHNKLRMEHENDRHIGDAAALMILTIILGAMILYFIKHRATGNGRKEKARKSVRASSDANSEHEMRTSLTRQDESVGMGSPKPIDESQFVAISAREPSSDEQLTFSAALTTAAQNDPRNSTGSASSSGSNTYVQSCTPNAMTAQLASTSEGAAGRRVGILEALVPARRLMVDEGTDLDDDPGKEETIAKEIQVAVHQSQGQRTGVLLPIKIAWDKVTDLLMKNLQIKEVDYGRPCQDCGVNCAGFKPHQWRKSCSNCKCPRESHDIYNEENVSSKERLGIKTNADKKCDHSSALSPDLSNSAKDRTLSHAHPRAQGYSWVPPGLPADKIDRYFRELPNHKVPKASSPGEKYRDKQLILQLPKQDLALPYCKFLEKEHHKAFEDFVNTRNECALDIGFVCEALDAPVDCRRCGGILPAGQLGVIAPKFGEQVAWHSACFACDTCHELLVDLTYCMKDGRIFCERHYAEQIKPRCAACDELIFSGEY